MQTDTHGSSGDIPDIADRQGECVVADRAPASRRSAPIDTFFAIQALLWNGLPILILERPSA